MKHFTPTIIIELENITNNEHVVPGTKFTSLRPHQKGFVRIYAAELNRIKFLAGLSNNNIRPVFKLHSIDGAPVKYPQKTDEKDAPEPDLKDKVKIEVPQPIIEIDKDVDEAKEVKDTTNDEVPQPIIEIDKDVDEAKEVKDTTNDEVSQPIIEIDKDVDEAKEVKDTANDEVPQSIIEIDKDVDEAKEVKDTANDEVPQPIIEIDKDVDEAKEVKDTVNDEVPQPIIEIDKDVDEAKEVKDTANDEVPQPIIDGIDEDMPGRIPEAMIKKAEGADEKPKRKRSPKKKTESAKDSTPGNE